MRLWPFVVLRREMFILYIKSVYRIPYIYIYDYICIEDKHLNRLLALWNHLLLWWPTELQKGCSSLNKQCENNVKTMWTYVLLKMHYFWNVKNCILKVQTKKTCEQTDLFKQFWSFVMCSFFIWFHVFAPGTHCFAINNMWEKCERNTFWKFMLKKCEAKAETVHTCWIMWKKCSWKVPFS